MDPQTPNQPTPGGTVTPETSGGLPANGPASTAFVSSNNGMSRRKKVLIGAGIAAVVVLGVAGYVFGYYLPNRPSNVYGRALSNTSKGYDKLIEYANSKDLAKKFDTTEVNGTLTISGQGVSGDGSFKGKSDKAGNATFSGDFGMSGVRVNFEGMSKDVENSESPDVYFKVKGLKGIDQLSGMGLEQFDDKWVSVDHTFFDSYAKQAVGESGDLKSPTSEQIVDAAKKVGEVNKMYLLTDDKSKAVFEMQEYKGKEVVDGKNTMHYVVKTNKDHLKTYVDELGKALDKSKLNQWAQDNYKKNLSELVNTSSLKDEASSMEDQTFDMWVNTKTKMIHKVRFEMPNKDYTDIGLNYDGGDEYPFFINGKEGENTFKLGLSLNTKTNVMKLKAEMKTGGESAVTINANAEVKPSTGKVEVTPPSDAMPLMEALGGFMSASMLGAQHNGAAEFDAGLSQELSTELESYTITQ